MQDKITEFISKLRINIERSQRKFDMQFVFCMDMRAEPLRRFIEQNEHYETFGCAGVFGSESNPEIPISLFDMETVLRTIGLTNNFASIVMICGHSDIVPHEQDAINCAACNGAPSGPNARRLATALNTSQMRSALAQKNIVIPEDTHFISGEHNTVNGNISIYDCDLVPRALFAQLAKAQEYLRAYTTNNLDQGRIVSQTDSFIIAPRSFTIGMDLQAKTFLHSYQYDQDIKDHTFLRNIMMNGLLIAYNLSKAYRRKYNVPSVSFIVIIHAPYGLISQIVAASTDLTELVLSKSIEIISIDPLCNDIKIVTIPQTDALYEL